MKHIKEDVQETELPRNQIFTGRLEQKFLAWYRKFFSIKEIENESILQWAFGALLLTYLVSFSYLASTNSITTKAYQDGVHSCWSYFKSCGEYYFLSNIPYGFSQPILYMFFFGIMILIVMLMWKKDWVLAHMLLGILFIWKLLVLFVLTASGGGNFNYFDVIFSIVILALPYKLFFLKLSFVMLYFLASTIKIHEGWILGNYFTTLKGGMPIFSNGLTPLLTNLVIFMQMVGSWFLLSGNKFLQRTVLIYFLCFHFYSGLLVYYRYPITTIPMLLILFGPMYSQTAIPISKKALWGWAFFIVLILWQVLPHSIQGDQKITLEGNKFGLFMFEANHQCVSQTQVHLDDGSKNEFVKESFSARERCDPYKIWFRIQQLCTRYNNIDHISWKFDHSINGNPFYRIVDENDVCSLEYKTFTHNEWIKLPKDNPEIIGKPLQNLYSY